MSEARILVVDDDPGMVRAVNRILGRTYDVTCAAGPQAALDLAETLAPDLAILDIRMPGMDGFELMRRLKERYPDLDVIFMTGNVGEADAHLIAAIRHGAFYFIQKPFDRRVLQTLVERCLELRRLRQDRQQQMRALERELAEARHFQQSLLPPPQNRMQGISITARYLACTELGGDLYDYDDAGSGRVAVLIADVSGHGASAAMMTGIVKSAFHASHVDAYEPAAVLQRVTASIRAFDAERFVTLFCARLQSNEPSLDYVNAGHPPAIVWSPGSAPRLLAATGPLISSAFPDLTWEQRSIPLSREDRLLLYTDGITEARTHQGDFFGCERILSRLSPDGQVGSELLDGILSAVKAFTGSRPYTDDMTMLVAEFE